MEHSGSEIEITIELTCRQPNLVQSNWWLSGYPLRLVSRTRIFFVISNVKGNKEKAPVRRHLSSDHLVLKVSGKSKTILQKAARLSGYRSVNSFVLAAAVTSAYHVIEEHEGILKTEKARKSFFAVLENPSPPNAALRSAFNKLPELTTH